ncbi:MAG TPA: riboflavin synthase [Actinomycetota bacterium]|nr:riboflavin synthase [Actinomycetota bacterium]
MFTGLVEQVGIVDACDSSSISIRSRYADLTTGESICVAGVCLSVVTSEGDRFTADVSEETLSRSTLGLLQPGDGVNLERSLLAGARMGGHFVQGHVDGVAEVESVVVLDGSNEVSITAPAHLMRYIAEKGSISVDGVSLTVVSVTPSSFSVSLVPITLETTTLGKLDVGIRVNLETDVLAKYVESIIATERH